MNAGPTLSVVSGPDRGRTFQLVAPLAVIGREAGNAVEIPSDQRVSRRHAQVELRTDGTWLTDLGSTGGTFVNGQPVTAPYRLRHGDQVQIGETVLMFSEADSEQTIAPTPGAPAYAPPPVAAPAVPMPVAQPAPRRDEEPRRRGLSIWFILILLLGVLLGGFALFLVLTRNRETEVAEPPAANEIVSSRTAAIKGIEGTVMARLGTADDFTEATEGTLLFEGDELRSNADGRAALVMDDGTIVTFVQATLGLGTTMQGTPDVPQTRFMLNTGEIFSIREDPLPPQAFYEVETNSGVGAIRGTCMSVSSNPDIGHTVGTCLTGSCSLTGNEVTVAFTDGQAVEIAGFGQAPGEIRIMTQEEVQAWIDVLAFLRSVGIDAGCGPAGQPGGVYAPETETEGGGS